MSAACELQKSRCSLPGDCDCASTAVTHVEVEIAEAVDILAGSTMRSEASMPILRRLSMNGAGDALVGRIVAEELDPELLAGLCVDASCRRLIIQPASLKSSKARRRFSRVACGVS